MASDLSTMIALGISNSERSVTSAGTLVAQLKALQSIGGGRAVLDPNINFTPDWTTLPANLKNVAIIGVGSGGDGSAPSVIAPTALPTADDATDWQYCLFKDIVLTAPTLTGGTVKGFAAGTGNKFLVFDNVWWVDWFPQITHNLGPSVWVRGGGCRALTLTQGGGAVPRWSGPLGPFFMDDYVHDAPVGAVGFAGYSQVPTGPWRIRGLKFNLLNTYWSDGAIDCEGATAGPPSIEISDSTIQNGKIYLMNAGAGYIHDCTLLRSTLYGGTTPYGITTLGAGTPPASGPLRVARITCIDPVFGSNQATIRTTWIQITRDAQLAALTLDDIAIFYSNRLQAGTVAQQCLIDVSATATNAGNPPFGPISMKKLRFGCVENGGSALNSLIHVGASAAPGGAFDDISIEDVAEIKAGVSGPGIPTTVAHSYVNGIQYGNAGVTISFGRLLLRRARFPSATGAPIVSAGTISAIIKDWAELFPVNANDTYANPGTGVNITHGTTNLVTAAKPAWGPGRITLVGGAGVTSVVINGIQAYSQASAALPGVTFDIELGDTFNVVFATTFPTCSFTPKTNSR